MIYSYRPSARLSEDTNFVAPDVHELLVQTLRGCSQNRHLIVLVDNDDSLVVDVVDLGAVQTDPDWLMLTHYRRLTAHVHLGLALLQLCLSRATLQSAEPALGRRVRSCRDGLDGRGVAILV